MHSIQLAFTCAIYEITFESDVLCKRFSDAFCVPRDDQGTWLDNRTVRHIAVTGIKDGDFAVYLDGRMVCEDATMPRAAYCVTQMMGEAFCSWVGETVCVMHAASVLCREKIVLFSGVSGSGKTSLALEFSRYGEFAGDECVFLDMSTGAAWHEEFPFQLKADNKELLLRYGKDRALEVHGDLYGTAFYLPLDSVAFHPVKKEDGIAVSAIIFPHFLPEMEGSFIEKLPADKFPEYILGSLMGAKPPSSLFAQFVHMSAKHGLRFYDMKYSDLTEGANELDKWLLKDGV